MTLEEMIELGVLFQRLAASKGAVIVETTSVCRVDQVSNLTAADFNRVSELASALTLADQGTLAVFGVSAGRSTLQMETCRVSRTNL